MASSVDVTFGVDTKLLEKLIKNFSTLQKQLKNLNIKNYKNRFFGELSSYNGRFGKKGMATFLKNFTDPEFMARTYSNKFLKMSNFISTKEFANLLPEQQEKILSKKFPLKSYASAELLKKVYDVDGNKQKIKDLREQTIEYKKQYEQIGKIRILESNILDKRFIEKIKELKKQTNEIVKQQKEIQKLGRLEDKILNKRFLDKIKNLKNEIKEQQREYSKLTTKDNKLKKIIDNTYIKDIEQYSKPLINFGDFFDDFMEKVKTFGLYLGALSLFTFVKDIVSVRKEFESTSIMLGRVLGNFEEFSQNSSSQNIVEAKNLMKDLRNYANELGVEYGEMEKGFSKLANAVPKGTITFNDTLSSYKEMMKMFTLVGATADEQQGAIRAFYQMLEKGSLSAEEFNRQLGNTPLRAPVLQYALKGYNKMANDTLKNFDDLQNYLRSNNISTAEFFKTVFEESKLDPRNKENLYIYSLGADISRLNNAIQDFKLSLTGGLTEFNPILNSLTSGISTLTSLVQLFTKLMPLINLSVVGFAAFKSITFTSSKSLKDMTIYLTSMQKAFQEGKILDMMSLRNEFLKQSFIGLGSSVLTLSIAYSNLENALDSINSEGLNFSNTLQLILSSLFTISGIANILGGLKTLFLFKRVASIGHMNNLEKVGLLGTGAILHKKINRDISGEIISNAFSFSSFFSKDNFKKSFDNMKKTFNKMEKISLINYRKGYKTSGIIGGTTKAITSLLPSMLSLILNPYVIGLIILALLSFKIFKYFDDKNKQKQRENREREVMSRALVLNSSSMQNNYARVDVVADFPVKSQNINSGNLDVSVRSRLNLGSNI